jgi:hypothetical protein
VDYLYTDKQARTEIGDISLSKLSFDCHLIYNGPYLNNLSAPKFIEYVFGKRDSLPIYREAKEISFGRTIEEQLARQIRWIGNQQLNVKMEVRDF